jgi:hypothetical protein
MMAKTQIIKNGFLAQPSHSIQFSIFFITRVGRFVKRNFEKLWAKIRKRVEVLRKFYFFNQNDEFFNRRGNFLSKAQRPYCGRATSGLTGGVELGNLWT